MTEPHGKRSVTRAPRFTFDGVSLLAAVGALAGAYWFGQEPEVQRPWALIGLGIVIGVLNAQRWYWTPTTRPRPKWLSPGVAGGAAFLAAALVIAFASTSVQVVVLAACAGWLIVRAFQPPWANSQGDS